MLRGCYQNAIPANRHAGRARERALIAGLQFAVRRATGVFVRSLVTLFSNLNYAITALGFRADARLTRRTRGARSIHRFAICGATGVARCLKGALVAYFTHTGLYDAIAAVGQSRTGTVWLAAPTCFGLTIGVATLAGFGRVAGFTLLDTPVVTLEQRLALLTRGALVSRVLGLAVC